MRLDDGTQRTTTLQVPRAVQFNTFYPVCSADKRHHPPATGREQTGQKPIRSAEIVNMPDDRLRLIRELHAFTEAGIADCKRALDGASGDFFQAACQLLTLEAFREKDQAVRVRQMAGKSIIDPVTKAESHLMDRLREYYASLSVRPHHVYFSTEAFPRLLFADHAHFDRLRSPTGLSWLSHAWDSAGRELRSEHHLPPTGLDVVVVTLSANDEAAVIAMPTTVSEHEADFLVVRRHPRVFRVFNQSPRIRYFVICERIRAPDWNLVVAEEIIPKGHELVFKRCPNGEDVSTTPEGLAHLIKGFK